MEQRTLVLLLVTLSIIVISGFVTLLIIDPVLWLIVYESTALSPGSTAYSQWLEPKIDIRLQVYFFNLTNPEEFVFGAKPRVKQMGPYTYRERRFKSGIMKQYRPQTLRYKETKQYTFDRLASVGSEADIVTTTNLGFLAIDVKFGWLPQVVDSVIEFLENRTSEYLITSKTVKELLWGYEDPFLRLLKTFLIPVPTTMIGLYLGKNDTDDGLVEIFSSNKNPELFGRIYKYHNSEVLSFWTTQQANRINGSDGSLFHPYLSRNEHPYIFSADICRSIQLKPDRDENLHGVPATRYLPYADSFGSPLTTEKNRGFCLNWPHCMGDNIVDVSTCYPGSPIIMSLPHFSYANHTYQESVEGLHPSEELNTSFLIEPKTGVVFNAMKKLQINAVVKRNPKFHELSRVVDVYLPIMFMNESFNLDAPTAESIRSSLIEGPLVAKIVLSLIVVLLALVLIGLGFFYCLRRRLLSAPTVAVYESVPNEPDAS